MKVGSVALADILANGVAILLILIVLSLSIKQQDLEQELEQISEVGAIMSREIASSLITNALPSSAPAILHDYNHPRQKNTPRIALHKDYLLIDGENKYQNLKLSKAELLQENNLFDRFLTNLNALQSKRLRADIIHIKHYYLMMSIIKKHKKRISHWHFLGEAFQNGDNITGLEPYIQDKSILPSSIPDLTSDKFTTTKIPNLLTKNVDFLSGKKELNFKINDEYSNEEEVLFGSGSINSLELKRKVAKIAGEENEHFAKSLKIGFADGDITTADFQNNEKNNGSSPLSKQILNLIFSYLTHKQQLYQADQFVELSSEDFKKNALKRVGHHYQNQINTIYNNISAIGNKTIKINFNETPIDEIALLINQNLETLNLSKQHQTVFSLKNKVSINLYPKPTIDKAIAVNINDNSIVLFASHKFQTKGLDWQVVAILNAGLNKIKIGFIYGELINEVLKIKTLENDVRINHTLIDNPYQVDSNWQYLWWMALILIFLIFIKLLYGRRNA